LRDVTDKVADAERKDGRKEGRKRSTKGFTANRLAIAKGRF
jgi:hypothetical protein